MVTCSYSRSEGTRTRHKLRLSGQPKHVEPTPLPAWIRREISARNRLRRLQISQDLLLFEGNHGHNSALALKLKTRVEGLKVILRP